MKTTKLIVSASILLFISVFITSCGTSSSDREKDEKDTKECIKEKSEKEKYKTIEEAIANYDFVIARKYLSCYPNTCYAYDGGRCSCPGAGENRNKFYKEEIAKSEIAYMLKNGEISKAQNIANESDMIEVYQKAVPEIINTFLENKNYDKIFNILTTWKFQSTFNAEEDPCVYSSSTNCSYNKETQQYNDLVDNILKHAIINNDNILAKKCLPLYVSEAICNSKTIDYTVSGNPCKGSMLKNNAKESAKQKMIEAGMKTN